MDVKSEMSYEARADFWSFMEANLNNAFVFSQPIINEKGNDMVNGAIMALVKTKSHDHITYF